MRISQLGAAQSGLRPVEVRTEEGTLEIRWPESVEQHGGSRVSRFSVSELLDAAAEARPPEDLVRVRVRPRVRANPNPNPNPLPSPNPKPNQARPQEDSRVAWGARLFSQEGHPTVAAAELRGEEGLRGALLRLRDFGVLRLTLTLTLTLTTHLSP